MVNFIFNMNSNVRKTFVYGLESSIMIGLFNHEKIEPQRISVDAEMWSTDHKKHERHVALEYIDYDHVRNLVLNVWPQRPHTEMLETLAAELLEHCLSYPKVVAAKVNISKLDLENTRKAGIELSGKSGSSISKWLPFSLFGPKLT